MAVNGLFLCLQLFLWYSSAEQLNEPNFEQDDDNTTMKVPFILQNPFLYYLDYKTVYVNCSVYGESPFEVSWLYSTDEISNRSSDYTIISGSKVSNIVYNPNSDDEGYVWWNSSLLLNLINNSTAGYYYCRVNTSFGLMYSKSVFVRGTYLPRLNFTKFIKSGNSVFGTWRVISFPLPNILISIQFLNSGPIYQKRVYNDYMTANVSNNFYNTSHYNTYVNETSDNSLTVHWRIYFHELFSMQLIAISYDYLSQKAYHHKLYNHSGQPYVNFLTLSFTEQKVTFTCLCAECDGIEWRKNNIPIPKSSYGVVALKKELWPYHSINLKHSTLSTSYYDRSHYSCHTVHYQSDIFENSPAYIDVPFAEIIESPKASTYVPGETLIQKCSARSLYPMTVIWYEPSLFFVINKKKDSDETDGLYNILNSTISIRISFLTPLSFYILCAFNTHIYFQPENFTEVHGLYQKGLLFERPIRTIADNYTPYVKMTIQHPSSISSIVTNITINETERMYLWCFARGVPQPTIIWYLNKRQLHSNSYLTITNPSAQQSAVIILQTRYERDKGTYTCEAKNGVTNLINAKQSHNITVNIQVAPEIELPKNLTVYESDNVTITVKVARAHPPVLPDHISWTYWTTASNGSVTMPSIEEGYDSRFNISEDNRSLYISDLTSDDEGYYHVLIWHPAGYKNKTTYLKVNIIPVGTEGKPSTASSTTNSNGLIIGTALASGFAVIVLCLIVVGVICIKRRKSRTELMMAFEMEIRLRLMSTSSNNAEICLNKIDQEVLKNIPYALLMKKTHLKILDCVGQGEFAKVYKGHYYIDSQCITVAVKALKVKSEVDKVDGMEYDEDTKDTLYVDKKIVEKELFGPAISGIIDCTVAAIKKNEFKLQSPVILQDPFLYYLDYKTVYVNCSVHGESPFEVSWLYSTDEISNRSSDYTIISGSKVSNIVYSPNSDDEGYVWWNSSLLLNPINNLTVGYYYCRVNTSFDLMYSKPVYIKNTYMPRLNSSFTNFVSDGQAYVNFNSLSFDDHIITFSCLCAECDDIEWRRDNVPIPKSDYGVVVLKIELWPYHSINLKHSKYSISFFDLSHYSCHLPNGLFENSPAFIRNPCKQ
uniref:Ig-like domain-containing protein n=1 Tax=Amphimedon queenslandica TaxID=400682 RepID=A0A1X7URW8_AMPQE